MKYHLNLYGPKPTETCLASYLKLPKLCKEKAPYRKPRGRFRHQKASLYIHNLTTTNNQEHLKAEMEKTVFKDKKTQTKSNMNRET